MNSRILMKKILFFLVAFGVSVFSFGQQGLKLGTNPGTINPNALLDLTGTTNRGLLLPRVALTSTSSSAPLSGTITSGMVIYNTATAADVTPGFYYHDGTRWVRLATNGAGGLINLPNKALSSTTTPVGNSVGEIIYNTNAASGVPVGTVVWNGTQWVASGSQTLSLAGSTLSISGGNSVTLPSATNLYNADGALTGNRTVTMGANTLSLTGTNAGAGNVANQSLLRLVRPGTSGVRFTPSLDFQVGGYNSGVSGDTWARTRATFRLANADMTGGATDSDIMSLFSDGRVGIGTVAPAYPLEIENSGGAQGINLGIRRNGAGTLGITFEQAGVAAFGIGADATTGDFIFRSGWMSTGAGTERMRINQANGAVRINNLAGTGSRMVVADATGALSTQTLPVNTDAQTLSLAGSTLSISGGNSVTLPSATNIYNADGTLTGARTLTQGANGLTFTGAGGLQKYSGAAGSVALFNIGRTATELEVGVSASGGQGFVNTVAGDSWVGANSNLFVGSKGAGSLGLMTNGLQRMNITQSGNVGIGIASPPARLTVQSDSTASNVYASLRRANAGTIGLSFEQVGVRAYGIGIEATSGDFIFRDNWWTGANGTEQLRIIRSTGNLRVNSLAGTGSRMVVADATGALSTQTLPVNTDAQTLSLAGSTLSISGGNSVTLPSATNLYNADGALTGNRTVTMGTNTLSFTGTNAGAGDVPNQSLLRLVRPGTGGVRFTPSLDFQVGGYSSGVSGDTWARTRATFRLADANMTGGATDTDVMTLLSNGAVGIGTSTPSTRLHVQGSVAGGGAVASESIFRMVRPGTAGVSWHKVFDVALGSFGSAGSQSMATFRLANGNSTGETDANIMSLFSDGRVGIGTVAPAYPLEIENSGGAQGINLGIRRNGAGTLGITFEQAGVAAFGIGSDATTGDFIFRSGWMSTGAGTERMRINQSNGAVRINNLAGTGSRMVVADATGALSTQSLPVNTDAQTLSLAGSTLSISGGNSVTLPSATNLYNADGALTGTRTVTMGSNNLNFIGTGKIGIGTNNPAERLSIVGTGPLGMNINNGVGNIRFAVAEAATHYGLPAAGDVMIQTISNTGIGFGTNGDNLRMYLNAAGNFGVGTFTPSSKLHVVGGNGLATSGTTTGAAFRVYGSGNHGLDFGTFTASPFGGYIQSTDQNNLALGYPLALNPVAGNVGIGTSAPSTRLQVNGSVAGGGAVASEAILKIVRPGTSGVSWDKAMDITLGSFGGTGSQSRATFRLANGNSVAGATDTDVMTLLSNGAVGIGTNSPVERLSIVGTGSLGMNINNGVGNIRFAVASGPTAYGMPAAGDLAIQSISNTGVGFATNGDNVRLYLTNDGRVGMGTTNPVEKFSLVSTGPTGFNINNGVGNFRLSLGSASGHYGLPNAGDIMVQTVNNTGVGIGTNGDKLRAYWPNSGATVLYAPSLINNNPGVSDPERVLSLFRTGESGIKWSSDVQFRVGTWQYNTDANARLDITMSGTIPENQIQVMTLRSDQRVGIATTTPGYTLHVNGSVAGTSAYVNLSDARLKMNVSTLTGALDKIMQLRGVTFDWNKAADATKELDDKQHIGFIAQEIEKVLPQVVSTADDAMKTKSVAYSDVVPVLVEAIKELKAENDRLKSQVSELDALKAEVSTIKAMLDTNKSKTVGE